MDKANTSPYRISRILMQIYGKIEEKQKKMEIIVRLE